MDLLAREDIPKHHPGDPEFVSTKLQKDPSEDDRQQQDVVLVQQVPEEEEIPDPEKVVGLLIVYVLLEYYN